MTDEIRLSLAKELLVALEKGDATAADRLIDEIAKVRECELFQEVGRLTRQLHTTLGSFSGDSKLFSLTETDIPNAKERLRYVITMTEQAANQTLNVVEDVLPVSEKINKQAAELDVKWHRFLDREMPFEEFKEMSFEITQHFKESKQSLDVIQTGLNDILLAQGFQDITGQVIRRVIELVQDLEASMVELIRVSGKKLTPEQKADVGDAFGPVVPGVDDRQGDVVNNQDEVDDLLSSLGF